MKKIYIGEQDKLKIINDYLANNDIDKVYVIGDDLGIGENIKFSDTIRYVYFYRLLQEISQKSLIVLNECLRKQDRYDLTYNCIRRYCLQTSNVLIFNYFPIIKQEQDFMILYDMTQNNPFLKEPYKYMTHFENVEVGTVEYNVKKTDITVSDECVSAYETEKENIIHQVKKDPDIIPRRLLKFSEKNKPDGYDRLDKIKPTMNVAVSNLKVDQYYYNELMKFGEELNNVLQRIHG